jgi:hypothetical protein
MAVSNRLIDLFGQTFGYWTVIGPNQKHPTRTDSHWPCRCICGATKLVTGGNLRYGRTRSCGCRMYDLIGQKNSTHGMSKTRIYHTWHQMLRRCENSAFYDYRYYGARGIRVCERWHKFENFYADMGDKPGRGYSLDRYPDNDGNYEPGNCRWATRKEQSRNRRSNRPLTFNGKTQILGEWAKEIGVKSNTLSCRIRNGWTLERALTIPAQEQPDA